MYGEKIRIHDKIPSKRWLNALIHAIIGHKSSFSQKALVQIGAAYFHLNRALFIQVYQFSQCAFDIRINLIPLHGHGKDPERKSNSFFVWISFLYSIYVASEMQSVIYCTPLIVKYAFINTDWNWYGWRCVRCIQDVNWNFYPFICQMKRKEITRKFMQQTFEMSWPSKYLLLMSWHFYIHFMKCWFTRFSNTQRINEWWWRKNSSYTYNLYI